MGLSGPIILVFGRVQSKVGLHSNIVGSLSIIINARIGINNIPMMFGFPGNGMDDYKQLYHVLTVAHITGM